MERSASNSVHLTWAMPRRASSSRSDRSKVKRCGSTSQPGELGSYTGIFGPAMTSRDLRRGVVIGWHSRTREFVISCHRYFRISGTLSSVALGEVG